MDTNYYFAENGEYLSSAPANAGSMPPQNAVRTAPTFKDGFWPVRGNEGDEWVLVEDHRGKTGWVSGTPTRIDALGPLPENWQDDQPPEPDTRTVGEKRRDDFVREADPLRDQALAYDLEMEALFLTGEADQAAATDEKRRRFLSAYLEKKKEIRARHPKGHGGERSAAPIEPAAPNTSDAPVAPDTPDASGGERTLYLTSAGTVHRSGCRYTSAPGRWVTEGEVRVLGGKAKPCGLCKAGAPEE